MDGSTTEVIMLDLLVPRWLQTAIAVCFVLWLVASLMAAIVGG